MFPPLQVNDGIYRSGSGADRKRDNSLCLVMGNICIQHLCARHNHNGFFLSSDDALVRIQVELGSLEGAVGFHPSARMGTFAPRLYPRTARGGDPSSPPHRAAARMERDVGLATLPAPLYVMQLIL